MVLDGVGVMLLVGVRVGDLVLLGVGDTGMGVSVTVDVSVLVGETVRV